MSLGGLWFWKILWFRGPFAPKTLSLTYNFDDNTFSLTFGNGAIFLDSDLKSCSTSSSETFANPDLLTNQNTSCPFEVQTLEIFTFIQEELEWILILINILILYKNIKTGIIYEKSFSEQVLQIIHSMSSIYLNVNS